MAFTEKLTLLVDVITGNSKSSLGQLKTDLKNADGAFGKLKVSASAVGDVLKQHVGLLAFGASAAIGTFATKAVEDFQKVALGAGVLRDKLGVTAEEASRLQEVAGDLGIPVATLATTFGRMNKAAADTPSAFDNIGAAIARNQDGTVNTNQTFLNTIDALNRIPDATERASAAQKIFGRGWAQISELVGMGADDLAKRLGEVEGTKIISDDEIAKAREMRDRFDDLHDKVEDVTLAVGGGLLPVVVALADAALAVVPPFAKIAEAYGKVQDLNKKQDKGFFEGLASGALKSLPSQFDDFKSHFHDLQDELHGRNFVREVTDDLGNFGRQVGEVQGPVAMTAEELVNMALAYREAGIAADVIGGKFVVGEAAIREAGKATHDAGTEASAFETRVQDAAYAEQALATQAEEARTALRDLRSEVTQSLGATFDYEKNTLALSDAVRDITSRIDDYNTMLAENADGQKDNNHSADELAGALTAVREAQIGAADQALATATAFAGQNGAVEGSRKFTVRLREELQRLADANPAIRGEIQAFIDKLNAIPSPKPKVTLDHADADKGADDVGKKIKDIPDADKKASLDTGDAMSAASAFEDRLNSIPDPDVTVHLNTGDAYSAANAFEARLNSIQDETVNVVTNYLTTGQHRATGGPVEAGQPYTVGESGPETFVPSVDGRIQSNSQSRSALSPSSRVRSAFRRAAGFANSADELYKEAKALRDLAKATDDAKKKEEYLNQARDKSSRADDKLAKSRDIATAAVQKHSDAIQHESDVLERDAQQAHNQADQLRERSDAISEQAASLGEAVDATFQMRDAQRQAADAAKAVLEADKTTTVGSRERAEAYDAAAESALNLARAQVEVARQRAEARGQEFSDLSATRMLRSSLLSQAGHTNAATAVAIRELIGSMDFDEMIRLQKMAVQRDKDAAHKDTSAKSLQKSSNALERIANRLENGNVGRGISLTVNGSGIASPEAIIRAIKQYEKRNGARWRR